MENEVLNVENQQEVTPPQEEVITPPVTEEQPQEEVITTPPVTEEQLSPNEEVVVIPSEELESLMSEILNYKEEIAPPLEVTPTEEKDEQDIITDQELEEIENIITGLEEEVTQKNDKISELETKSSEQDTKISELSNQITTISNELETTSTNYKKLEDWLNKISEHPIIWPLAIKIIEWELIDIPNYLSKLLDEESDSIPNIWDITNPISKIVESTPKSKILESMNKSYK